MTYVFSGTLKPCSLVMLDFVECWIKGCFVLSLLVSPPGFSWQAYVLLVMAALRSRCGHHIFAL